jgi:hypothetical protein
MAAADGKFAFFCFKGSWIAGKADAKKSKQRLLNASGKIKFYVIRGKEVMCKRDLVQIRQIRVFHAR